MRGAVSRVRGAGPGVQTAVGQHVTCAVARLRCLPPCPLAGRRSLGGFRQAPAQADSAFPSQDCPPLGAQCRGGRRRAGSELPSGSWTGRPVLVPGSDFNTETSHPSPFICKVGSSFPSPHCSPGPWGAAGVLCAGQGALGTPRHGTCHHRDNQTLGYSQSQNHSYRGPHLQLEGLFCALVSRDVREGRGTPLLTVCDPVTLGPAEMGGLQEVVWQCLTLSVSAGAGCSSCLTSGPRVGAGGALPAARGLPRAVLGGPGSSSGCRR